VAWDGYTPIQIEGALQSAVIYLETGRTPDDVYSGIGEGFSPPTIPIATKVIVAAGHSWPIHMVSSGIPAPCAVESLRWRRKRARADVLGVPGKLTVAGGWAKSLNLPLPTLATPWLDFHMVGDLDLVKRLLHDVRGLGRDASRGLGSVLGFEIREHEGSVLVANGVPLRSIPVDEGKSDLGINFDACEVRPATTYAPYWHRASVTLCAVPKVRTLLELDVA
jgi:hypothetical protein